MVLDALPASKSRKVSLDPAAALAAQLRRERKAQGITLHRLSTTTGVGIANLHRLENTGQGRVATFRAVAEALSVRVSGLPDRSRGNDLAARIKRARAKANLSVPELSIRAAVSRESVARLEAGCGNLSTLYAVVRALQCSIGLKNEMARVWAPAIGYRDSRFTPPIVLDVLIGIFGPVSLDPCWAPQCLVTTEQAFTIQDDGLRQEWCGQFIYVNPPYSESQKWALKCREQFEGGNAKVIVGLFKSTTDGATFHRIARTADTLFVNGRIAFLRPDGRRMGPGVAPFGLVFYLWGASATQVEALARAFDARHLPPG